MLLPQLPAPAHEPGPYVRSTVELTQAKPGLAQVTSTYGAALHAPALHVPAEVYCRLTVPLAQTLPGCVHTTPAHGSAAQPLFEPLQPKEHVEAFGV